MDDFFRTMTAQFPELEAPLRQLLGIGVPRRIFVCSPLRGDIEGNMSRAIVYCRLVLNAGHVPFAPHLYFTRFLDDENAKERELGLNLALFELSRCDALWAFVPPGGPSEGMKGEIAFAKRRGIPVQLVDLPAEVA